ncbi:alpha-amylase family glycosyl hydrolase [Isoptericola sp. NPDC056618]|uniref:alpha-amylase family glycosyl hydrolase n=1 Tax=Isoptericola sp. NPDC056618 TaxID=3345878 RepID=UPI0036C28994
MSSRGVELLTYTDRLGGDLVGLRRLLDGPLRAFSGVHVLPFFTPFDGADAGFDPLDHRAVDPRLGHWPDVAALADRREVTVDLVVNHVSSGSPEFVDWLERGADSPYDGMFLEFDDVFPDGASAADVTSFYRPRPGLPFTAYPSADGTRRLVWTTFAPSQVDLDVASPQAEAYLQDVLGLLRQHGVTTVRLDAVGYAVKTPGTSSFMTDETLAFVERITAVARRIGLRVLVEVHAHHSQQQRIAPLVDLVYDFATPPLLLHAWGTGDLGPMRRWLKVRPSNAVTVLDTHDGIGIIDAGPSGDHAGLLDESQMAAVFDRAAEATGGHSRLASVVPQWATMPHQVNATFLSVLGENPESLLAARALQLWLPGEPQIYYVGLLGGTDDRALAAATGQGREVNRHRYSPEEVAAALESDLTRATLALVRLRTEHPGFGGDFRWSSPGPRALRCEWTHPDGSARLDLDLSGVPDASPSFRITLQDHESTRELSSLTDLKELR